MTAERLMMLGGVVAFLITLVCVRSRALREKYALGWMLVACGLLLVGVFPRAIMALADASHLAYPSAVLFVALAVIYLFSMCVSIALSRQYRTIVRLVQELALLKQQIAEQPLQRSAPDPTVIDT